MQEAFERRQKTRELTVVVFQMISINVGHHRDPPPDQPRFGGDHEFGNLPRAVVELERPERVAGDRGEGEHRSDERRHAQRDGVLDRAGEPGDEVLVEEWLRGVEISVPVLGDKALPAVEIVPQSGTYDFESKYTLGATTEICPARISEEQTRAAQDQAMRAHQALGCKGCTRTDMIVLDDRIVCLEVNTLPGMTATSLVPNSAKTAGINFEDLCDWMVRNALEKTKA